MSAYGESEAARQPQSDDDRHENEPQTPYTDPYTAVPDSHRIMGPPPPVDPGLGHWTTPPPNVLNSELDSLMSPRSGYSPRFPESRVPYPDTSDVLSNPQQPIQLPSMKDPNPLVRYWGDTTGPWNSQQVNLTSPRAYGPLSPANGFRYPRSSPRSDVSSSNTGIRPPDSSWGSKSMMSTSSQSFETPDQNPECHSITGHMDAMRVNVYQDNASFSNGDIHHSDQPYGASVENGPSYPLKCNYEGCQHVSKNHSEHKKHMSRHTRPHRCRASNCEKTFSTNNDLERHMKSVHKIAPRSGTDKSYRCAALNCSKKDKLWPRLDNFRQHCSRIHKGEDIDELVRKSEVSREPSHRSVCSIPDISVADPNRWTENSWDGSSSDYTSLPQLNLSPHHTQGPNLQPLKRQRLAGSLSPISNCGQETPPLKQFRSPEMIGSGASPEYQSIQTNDSDPGHPSASEPQALHRADRSHYSPGLKRPRSINRFEQSGLVERSLAENNVSEFNENRKDEESRLLRSNFPGELKLTQELSQELILEITKKILQTENRGDFESAIKDQVHRVLNTGLASTRAEEFPRYKVSPESAEKRCKCDQCHKFFKRRCDLRKHKKRHSRPYGCTFEGCTKKFGSKNDWKRHENTRHYRIEAWRCHEPNPTSKINQCAKVFHRREQYQAHLKEQHNIKDDAEIRQRSQKHRVGRNGQSGFWCGFCQQIIPLTSKGLEAWDERFDHIDSQHFSKEMTIDSWYPLDKDIPIGDMLPSNSLDNNASPLVNGDRSSSEDSSEEGNQDYSSVSADGEAMEIQPPDIGKPVLMPAAGERSNRKSVWYCCACSDGPNSLKFDDSCVRCSRRRCPTCKHSTIKVTNE